MADIQAVNALDNTTLNCELTLSFSQRTKNSVTVSYTAVTYLNSSGFSGAGYESYTAQIRIWGNNVTEKTVNITLKEKAEQWSGSQKHTKKGSFTLSLLTAGAVYPKVSYRVKSSADTKNSVYGTTSLTCPIYSPPAPGNPDSVSVSNGQPYYGQTVSVSFGAVNEATGYKIYKSLNGSGYSLCGNVSESPFKYTVTDDFNSGIRFKVCAYNSGGMSSGRVSEKLTVIGGLRRRVSGKWTPCNVYVKVSGKWKRVKCVYIKQNGSWCKAK